MRWIVAAGMAALLCSCGTVSKIEGWSVPVARAKEVLIRVGDRANFYATRLEELDGNQDGVLDIWELLRGLQVLRETLKEER